MSNKKVVRLGSVTFDYSLHLMEFDEPNNILSEVELSESGIHLVWQNIIQTPYRTVVSKENGWQSQSIKDQLLSMYKMLDTTYILEYDDSSTETVRFAHEKPSIFTPLVEGGDKYTIQLNLAIVIP